MNEENGQNIVLKRKIYAKMLEWKERSSGRTALLIDGARRTGKSFVVKEFAKNNYDNYILIDFSNVDERLKGIFENHLYDVDEFFEYFEGYFGNKLIPRKTVIIFDEVQFFPRARAAIKHLVADGRYDYIETGSLVSIKENTQDILIPSEEEHLKMYPMDFEEFMWALGNEKLYEFIRERFNAKKEMGELHRKAMDLFRRYLIVGGMPQAVVEYVTTKNFNNVDHVKRNILNLYRDDMRKHGGRYELKVQSIFDLIPAQLGKAEKRFQLSSIEKDARFRSYEEAFLWLDEAMITNRCFNTTEPNIGLSMNITDISMKCYMADTGLLISHAFDDENLEREEIHKKILFDKLNFNGGMIMENIVAQMLRASGHRLFYFSSQSRENSEDRMEIDFLISKSKVTSRHNISPIEVKSGKNYTLNSLNKYRVKYGQYLDTPIVVHAGDLSEKDGILYLPLYMVPFL